MEVENAPKDLAKKARVLMQKGKVKDYLQILLQIEKMENRNSVAFH